MSETDTKDLTSGQVAERLGLSRQTVLKYAESGRLPCYRLPSGHRRFRLEDVEALTRPIPSIVPAHCKNGHDCGGVIPGSRIYCARCREWFTAEEVA